jgi:hypothetical protein
MLIPYKDSTRRAGRRISILCCALGALTASCQRASNQAAPHASADPFSAAIAHDRYADDLGRFLAGVPARAGSPFAELERQPPWIKHRQELDRAWDGMEQSSLPAMRGFQKQELGAATNPQAPVLYPFSGPDALMVTTFFPASPGYVMVGLEPVGTLPSPRQLGRKDLEKYLASVRATLASELSRSFFITREMDREFRGQVTDGLFLPILELLARSRHTILGFRYVRLNDRGEIIVRPAESWPARKISNKGVEIEFLRDEDQSVHKLLYFSVNLADASLQENQSFLAFLDALRGPDTLLKATSYMIHKPEFSMIRQRLLAISSAVLQDDSGIPYHFFDERSWRVQLYGAYVRPYGSFRWLEQADLRNAYLSSGVRSLNFRIGYGYGKIPSNLLLARKVN